MTDSEKHSCNNFEDSGEIFEFLSDCICKNCGWTKGTHHIWERMPRPNGALGLGWQCNRCGRTAYDMYGKCSEESPPIDYPPCSTWRSNS